MFTSGDDVGAIVADIGSFTTRVGFAGDDTPRAYFPTVSGHDAPPRMTRSSIIFALSPLSPHSQAVGVRHGGDAVGGKTLSYDLATFREQMAVDTPIKDGQIADWDLLERSWEHALSNYLRVEPKESPILVTEKPYNPPYARQRYVL